MRPRHQSYPSVERSSDRFLGQDATLRLRRLAYLLSRKSPKARWKCWRNGLPPSSSVNCRARHDYKLRMDSVNTRERSHSERAAHFKRHASNTKSPDTRGMYLRLAEVEMALAAKGDEPGEKLEQQTPRQANTGNS